MGRGALLTGTAGGIIGTIASVIGIIWLFLSLSTQLVFFWISVYIPYPGTQYFPFPMYTGPSGIQIAFTVLFAVLLLVSCILTGIGFYGEYTVGQSAMGVVGLAFGIIGGASMMILLLIGVFSVPSFSLFTYYELALGWNWLGFLLFGISCILMGSASIVVRETTTNPGAASAAGILSIIGGALFIIYPVIVTAFIGLVLVFVAFLLWAIVFYTTEA